MDNIARHIVFSGRVQGVGFRFTAHRIALRYELTGFVRNLPDGTVEVVAEGEAGCLDEMITRLRQGPPPARISEVLVSWHDATGRYPGFSVLQG